MFLKNGVDDVSGSKFCKESKVEKLEVPTDGSKVPNIHHLVEVLK